MLFPSGIGIDISDNHIRLAWLRHDGSVRALKEVPLPSGIVVDDQVEKAQLLQSHLQEILKDPELADLSGNVTALLPDSRVFVGTFWIDSALKREDFEAEALKRGQTVIPLPFKDALVGIELGGRAEDKSAVAVFAVPKKTAVELKSSLEIMEIPIVAMECDSCAVHRLVHDFLPDDVRNGHLKMFIDFGRRWINMSFFDAFGMLIFSRAIRVQSIISAGNPEAAGTTDKLSAEHVRHICVILQETIRYFQGIDDQPVSIFLAGSGGGVGEISQVCQEQLKKYPVSRVRDIVALDGLEPAVVQAFASAIGAARRSIKPRNYKNVHNFKEGLL